MEILPLDGPPFGGLPHWSCGHYAYRHTHDEALECAKQQIRDKMSQQKPKTDKPTPMRDIPIGSVVFTLTIFNEYNEIRETYYTKISETAYLHHGCIQGDPRLLEEDERPRYIKVNSKGFEYPMIATLPVFPIGQSRYRKFLPEGF